MPVTLTWAPLGTPATALTHEIPTVLELAVAVVATPNQV